MAAPGPHSSNTFSTVDYVVFGLTLAVSVAIGVYYAIRDRKATAADFLVARSKVSLVPVALSLMASYVSAVFVVGTPAEIFGNGVAFCLYVIGMSLGIIVTCVTFVPLLYPLKVISCFEYIGDRFNSRAARSVGALISSLGQVIYIGVAALAPSISLYAVTGFPLWVTIIVTIGVATLYTFLGGIRAVVLTDAFQLIVMVGGMIAIIVKGNSEVGGPQEVWELNKQWNRTTFININPDPRERHTLWGMIFGGVFMWTAIYGVNQSSIQRYASLSSLRKAQGSLLLNIIFCFLLFIIVGFVGVVIFAYHAQRGCNPLSAGITRDPNELVPLFVMDVVNYPAVPGLFLSSLFSGALSSISSCLSALAAMLLEDFVKPAFGRWIKERWHVIVSKILVVVSGAIGMAMAFLLLALQSGTLIQITITFTSCAVAPILGMFILAAAVPHANWIGAIVGSVAGLVMPMWFGIGKYFNKLPAKMLPLPDELCNITQGVRPIRLSLPELHGIQQAYELSYMWLPMFGTLVTVILGAIVSLMTGGYKQETDPQYMFPFLRRCFGSGKYDVTTEMYDPNLNHKKNGKPR